MEKGNFPIFITLVNTAACDQGICSQSLAIQESKLTVSGKNNRVLTFFKDGERGLVITNRKPEKDFKIDEVNIKQQIENQDKIIEVLKEKLGQTEMKLSETVKAFHDQEFENKKLIEENHANLLKIQQLEKYQTECISQKSDIEIERDQLLQYKLKSESQNNETIQFTVGVAG